LQSQRIHEWGASGRVSFRARPAEHKCAVIICAKPALVLKDGGLRIVHVVDEIVSFSITKLFHLSVSIVAVGKYILRVSFFVKHANGVPIAG